MMTENNANPEDNMPADDDALQPLADNDDINSQESGDVENPPFPEDDFDVESAIAAISTLGDLTAEEEAEVDDDEEDENLIEEELAEADTYEEFEGEEDALDYDEQRYMPPDSLTTEDVFTQADESEILDARFEEIPVSESTMPQPPPSVLHRGTLPSITPAILLIGVGGLLTLLLTTSDEPIPTSLLLSLAVAGVGVILLGQWLSSGRWSVGNFLFGVFLLLSGGTASALIQTETLTLTQAYPLLFTALGLSFVLTDIFTATANRVWFIGLILGLAGILGVLFTGDLLDDAMMGIVRIVVPIVIGLLVVFLIIPFFRRAPKPASETADE